ncbi:hypothetical protein ACFLRC_02655 [Candidatus Altiarchaeota archaeon]
MHKKPVRRVKGAESPPNVEKKEVEQDPGLFEEQRFQENIRRGLDETREKSSDTVGFLIVSKSGFTRAWNTLDEDHLEVRREVGVGMEECVLGVVTKSGQDIKKIMINRPYVRGDKVEGGEASRENLTRILRVFRRAGVSDNTQVYIGRDSYGDFQDLQKVDTHDLFPNLKQTKKIVSGKLSEFLETENTQ